MCSPLFPVFPSGSFSICSYWASTKSPCLTECHYSVAAFLSPGHQASPLLAWPQTLVLLILKKGHLFFCVILRLSTCVTDSFRPASPTHRSLEVPCRNSSVGLLDFCMLGANLEFPHSANAVAALLCAGLVASSSVRELTGHGPHSHWPQSNSKQVDKGLQL